MRLEQFEQFLALGEMHHFRRAAESCSLSTSALTRSIQTLEQELNIELVKRSTRSVRLTPAGELFLTFCKNTIQEYSDFRTQLSKLNKEESINKIVIGYGSEAASLVPLACGKFMQKHPEVSIEMQFHNWETLQDKLNKGEVDLAINKSILGLFGDASAVQLPEQVILFVHKDHPIAQKDKVNKDMLQPYPLLACLSQSQQVQKMLQDTAHSINKLASMKVGNMEQIIGFAEDANHIALAGIEYLSEIENKQDLVIIKPEDDSADLQLSIFTGLSPELHPTQQELLEYIFAEADSQQGVVLRKEPEVLAS